MDDINISEWRNIQNVVRESFTAMQRVISEQSDKIRTLERHQKDAASWTQVESSLAARATIQDVNQSLAGLAGVMNDKVTSADLSTACEERATRVEVQETNVALTRRIQMMEQENNDIRTELNNLKESMGRKMNQDQLSETYLTRSEIKANFVSMGDFNRLSERSAVQSEVNNARNNNARD